VASGVSGNQDSFEADQEQFAVQQQMVAQALQYARELDFETAERILEEASSVRESQELIEEAREEIAGYRVQRAEGLRLAAIRAMDSGSFNRVRQILIKLIALGGADSAVNQLRRRMEEARVYGGFQPGQVIKDQLSKVWDKITGRIAGHPVR
jgi:excinuclease UvrABC nuclease subunit